MLRDHGCYQSGFVNTKPLMLRQLTLLKRGCHGGFKQRAQESETLCRKGGTSRSDNSRRYVIMAATSRSDNSRRYVIMAATSRSDNAPHASGARAVAKLACGSSHDHYARTTCALDARYLLRGTIFRSPIVWQPIYCARTNPGGIFYQNCFRSFGRKR